MNDALNHILAKSVDSGGTTLVKHLEDVAKTAKVIAKSFDLDQKIAYKGAIMHDIGKVSPLFQMTLKHGYKRVPGTFFRHEIASLFFLSLLKDDYEKHAVIEMIAAHHKSIYKDVNELGLIDLDDNEDSFDVHSKDFDKWSPVALQILSYFGIETHPIDIDEAEANYNYAVDYCTGLPLNYSKWKGLLMAADHLASALDDKTDYVLDKLFIKPDLSFYDRKNELYPLSCISTDSLKPHTIVTAPTGAGKTDFLLRRCKGRVFYTLPFQASINAMYDRIKYDLKDTNAQVYLLHAASDLNTEDGKMEESIMQRHIGASVKVLTPHQMASVIFGIKGYESMIMDLKGCDIILDEIHTYSDTIQAIVLRIVEVLVAIGCRVHIGTATMPNVLYERILSLLGGKEKVYEVKLDNDILSSFNRHIIHKKESLVECMNVIDEAIESNKKILIVCNQVKRAQELYKSLSDKYYDIPSMLIHSRFKRGRRQELEKELKNDFNTMQKACIVVSTQVVEVSLDISFDLMITECAPIDALIQRFGRVNRKRTKDTIGKYKDIYVLSPPDDGHENDAWPYSLDVLKSSYDVLPDNGLMKETEVQHMLDKVYPTIDFKSIDFSGVAFCNGNWMLTELRHNPKSTLLDTLDINSAVCVTEDDKEIYKESNKKEYSKMEIPVSFRSVGHNKLEHINEKSKPFVVPSKAYSDEMGLLTEYAKPEYYNTFEII